MNYQLNPLLTEGWKSVTAGAALGGLGGAIAHEYKMGKLARNDYNEYISNPQNLKKEIAKCVARIKNNIAYLEGEISKWDDTIKMGIITDDLDKEEYTWLQTELQEEKEKLIGLKKVIASGNKQALIKYLKEIDYESNKFQSFRLKHSKQNGFDSVAKPLVGATLGGASVYYGKKAYDLLRNRAGSKIVKKIARRGK